MMNSVSDSSLINSDTSLVNEETQECNITVSKVITIFVMINVIGFIIYYTFF